MMGREKGSSEERISEKWHEILRLVLWGSRQKDLV